MRELGSVFQLRRTPSVSSIWLHWSLRASKSAMVCGGCGVYGEAVDVSWRGTRAPTIRSEGLTLRKQEMGVVEGGRAIINVAAARTGCNNTTDFARCTIPSSRGRWWACHRPGWQLRSSIPTPLSLAQPARPVKSRIFQPSPSLLLYIASTTNTT
jgi:hypothetical protein